MSIEERVVALEVKVDGLERETRDQTEMLKEHGKTLQSMQKILWMIFGAVGVVEFGIRLLELFKK